MISFSEAQILAWVTPVLWPFLRVLALFQILPVLGQRTVPARVRVALSFLVALCASGWRRRWIRCRWIRRWPSCCWSSSCSSA